MALLLVTFLNNFSLIALAIIGFSAPFIGTFWYRERRQIAANRPHFNYFMERFFLSPESNALILTWAAAEAVVWFVLPEFLLILMVFMKIKRKAQLVVFDVIGTVIGTLVAVGLHLTPTWLQAVPYIEPGMLTKVHEWYGQYGVLGIFFQPFSGVPYKVFTSLAADAHFFIPLFIVLAIIARMMRYLIIYELTKALYPVLHPFVRRHYVILMVIAVAVFTILLMRVSNSYA